MFAKQCLVVFLGLLKSCSKNLLKMWSNQRARKESRNKMLLLNYLLTMKTLFKNYCYRRRETIKHGKERKNKCMHNSVWSFCLAYLKHCLTNIALNATKRSNIGDRKKNVFQAIFDRSAEALADFVCLLQLFDQIFTNQDIGANSSNLYRLRTNFHCRDCLLSIVEYV